MSGTFTYKANYQEAYQALTKLNNSLEQQKVKAQKLAVTIHELEDGSKKLLGTYTALDKKGNKLIQTVDLSGRRIQALTTKYEEVERVIGTLNKQRLGWIDSHINKFASLSKDVEASSREMYNFQSATLSLQEAVKNWTGDYKELKNVITAAFQGQPIENFNKQIEQVVNKVVKLKDAFSRVGSEAAKSSGQEYQERVKNLNDVIKTVRLLSEEESKAEQERIEGRRNALNILVSFYKQEEEAARRVSQVKIEERRNSLNTLVSFYKQEEEAARRVAQVEVEEKRNALNTLVSFYKQEEEAARRVAQVEVEEKRNNLNTLISYHRQQQEEARRASQNEVENRRKDINILIQLERQKAEATKRAAEEIGRVFRTIDRQSSIRKEVSSAFGAQWGSQDLFMGGDPQIVARMVKQFNDLSGAAAKASASTDQVAMAIRKGLNREVAGSTPELQDLNRRALDLSATFAKMAASSDMPRDRFNQLSKALQDTVLQMRQTAKESNVIKQKLAMFQRLIFARVLTTVFYRLVEAIRSSVKEANDFMIAMAQVQTLADRHVRTLAGYAELTESMRRVSEQFAYTLTDITEAAYQSLSNQITSTIADTEMFLKQAGELSKMAVSTMPQSVNALSSVINAYNLSVVETIEINKTLFNMIEQGRIKLEEISDQFGNITTTAADLGVPLEEVSSALATMTIRGISSRVAMTLLRNLMYKMQRPTQEMENIMRQMGVTSAEQAIATYGFVGALQEMHRLTGRSSEALGRLLGTSRAMRGFFALFGDEGKRFNEIMEEGAERADEYAEVLETRMTNAAERVNREMQMFKNFFTVDISRRFIVFADILNGASDNMNEMENSSGRLSSTLKGTTKVLMGLVTTLSTFVVVKTIVGLFDSFIRQMKDVREAATLAGKSFAALSFKMGAFPSILGASVAVLSGVLTTIFLTYRTFEERMTKVTSRIERNISLKLSNTFETLGKRIRGMREDLREAEKDIMASFVEPFKDLQMQKSLIEFELIFEEETLDHLKKYLDYEKDILKEHEKRTVELENHIEKLEDALDLMEDIRREAQWDQEDFWFDRMLKDFHPDDHWQLQFSRAEMFLHDFINTYNEIYDQGPESLLENWDLLVSGADRYRQMVLEGDRSMWTTMERQAQEATREINEIRKKQMGQNFFPIEVTPQDIFPQWRDVADPYHMTFDTIMQNMFDAREKALKTLVQEGEQELEDQLTILDGQRFYVSEIEKHVKTIEKSWEAIKHFSDDNLLTEQQRDELINNQKSIMGDIAGLYKNIIPDLERVLELENDRVEAEIRLQDLKKEQQEQTDLIDKAKRVQDQDVELTKRALDTLSTISSFFDTVTQTLEARENKLERHIERDPYRSGVGSIGPVMPGSPINRSKESLERIKDFIDYDFSQTVRNLKESLDLAEITPEDLEKIQALVNNIDTARERFEGMYNSVGLSEKEVDYFTDQIIEASKNLEDLKNALTEFPDLHEAKESIPEELLQAQQEASNREETFQNTSIEKYNQMITELQNVKTAIVSSRSDWGSTGPAYNATGGIVNWKPKGTDTVPAMLTPGEFVVRSNVAKKNLNFLHALNFGGLDLKKPALNMSKPIYRSEGGPVSISNNNNITLNSTGYQDFDAILIGKALNREQRKGTLSLSGKRRIF